MTQSATSAHFDVLVVGSGVAGLTAAVRLASQTLGNGTLNVGVITKDELSQSTTRFAQGGIAGVLREDEDSTDLHVADTLAAGAGLCDKEAVRVLVDEGPGRIEELISLGAVFDREVSGSLSLAREGGHSRARVVHAGGAATGQEVERALVDATRQRVTKVLERTFTVDLMMSADRCVGVIARMPDGRLQEIRSTHVVLATGGAGQLYAVTTNPSQATGDGIAMALRVGVAVADMEFIQFHPTALHHPLMPRPLLSEALRGHGALIRDAHGERFVDEMAPRDVVSRAMAKRMQEDDVEHLYLDATGLENFADRFPTIAASLRNIGLDGAKDLLPIAPAAHHLSGGILTDLFGATEQPGLWAIGEAACSGAHGANRLASNSLLEGMVFGARLAERITSGGDGPSNTGALRILYDASSNDEPHGKSDINLRRIESMGLGAREPKTKVSTGVESESVAPRDSKALLHQLQLVMTKGAGVMRSASSLDEASRTIEKLSTQANSSLEFRNLLTVADAVLASAQARLETRGAHARSDFPTTDPTWRCRLVHRNWKANLLSDA
jgi:L-aspartate oxidase